MLLAVLSCLMIGLALGAWVDDIMYSISSTLPSHFFLTRTDLNFLHCSFIARKDCYDECFHRPFPSRNSHLITRYYELANKAIYNFMNKGWIVTDYDLHPITQFSAQADFSSAIKFYHPQQILLGSY